MLAEWAQKWGVSNDALKDLIEAATPTLSAPSGQSEAAVQVNVRMAASAAGMRLWRNNVGAFETDKGRPVRYGLCNESKQQNQRFKSSDLIGIRPVVVTDSHVGQTIGQFAAIETKCGDWKPGKDKRERAQAAFIALVVSLGGYGGFSNGGLP